MKNLSIDLRRRIVAAYAAKRSGTYEETAELFDVGEATVSRLLLCRHCAFMSPVAGPRKGLSLVTKSDLQMAHAAVRLAQRALKAAEHRFDCECTPVNTTTLMNDIRMAERRLANARSVLNRVLSSDRVL